jgi:hypothetical protein
MRPSGMPTPAPTATPRCESLDGCDAAAAVGVFIDEEVGEAVGEEELDVVDEDDELELDCVLLDAEEDEVVVTPMIVTVEAAAAKAW